MQKIFGLIKRFAPLLIALGIAFTFALVHLTIELGIFEYGPFGAKGYLRLLDLKALDMKFRGRNLESPPEPKVVVAAIDEKAIKKFGLWPWNRTVVADFIHAATEGGAKVIAFDAAFSDEDRNSAYVTIKEFVNNYQEAEVKPAKRLTKDLEATLKLGDYTEALLDLERVLKEWKGPGKAGVARSLAELAETVAKRQKNLEAVRATLGEWGRKSGAFHERLQRQVDSVSPDEALAAAVGRSPQTILGYIGFYDESAVPGIDPKEFAGAFARLEPAAITSVYEILTQDAGGQVVEMIRPASEVRVEDLQVRNMVAVLAPLPEIARAAKGFGYFNVPPDQDGTTRNVRLFHKHGDKLYPALSLAAVAKYLDAEIHPLNSELFPGTRLGEIELGGRLIPTDLHGRLLLNYYNDPQGYFPTYSVADFIDGTLKPEAYKDKVVLFGFTALGFMTDLRPTPFSEATPGVYIHATAIENLLDGLLMERFLGIALVEALLYLLLGLLLGLALPRLPVWGGLVAMVLFAVGLYFFDVWLVFSNGTWILNVLPTLQVAVTFLGINIHGYLTEGVEKRRIRKAFQFYVSRQVVDQMLKEPDKLTLGGERRVCTVLFSDIRGFTTISEQLPPEGLVHLLNSYLTPMTNLVFKYEGTLDKYMGDAIMAIFGAPITYTDHASKACFTSLDMMEELRQLQAHWREKGLPEIDIGIGLNTGPMSAGNMGSDVRFDYTVMGDNVNLGSRLEGINKQYGTHIIISESTYAAAKADVFAREMDAVRVKGKREPIRIFELLGRGKPTGAMSEMVHTFEKGLGLYKSQQWDDAIQCFEAVRQNHQPNDYASTMYIERCQAMKANPPAPDWDGAYTMTTK